MHLCVECLKFVHYMYHTRKWCEFPLILHCFELNKMFSTESSFSGFVIYYRLPVFEVENQEFPASLKLKTGSTGTLVAQHTNLNYVTSHTTIITQHFSK